MKYVISKRLKTKNKKVAEFFTIEEVQNFISFNKLKIKVNEDEMGKTYYFSSDDGKEYVLRGETFAFGRILPVSMDEKELEKLHE